MYGSLKFSEAWGQVCCRHELFALLMALERGVEPTAAQLKKAREIDNTLTDQVVNAAKELAAQGKRGITRAMIDEYIEQKARRK